jgi:hypothetical protein
VIDDWGRTPQPFAAPDGSKIYPPAYQQVVKGLPAVNYSARDIVYRPRNVRAHRVYGFSPVQQVLMTVNIGLRRQLWQLDYFTEGSIPDALIGVPQGWTPDQIKQFQDYWDTEFAGDLAKRRRAKFVPGETAAKVVQTKEPQHKDDFDEWLARIICFAFSVPPQWATKAMNRATAENHSAQAAEEGLEPTKEWVKDLIDEIVAEEFASPDLELHWLDEDEGDPETVLEGRLKVGALTLNEMRDALGLDPYDNAAADRPMVLTATGYVPIEANAGGVGGGASELGANRQGAKAETQSAKMALLKASPDDPDHPGWPAGTPEGRGGQFRPKDGDAAREGERISPAAHAESEPPERYAARDMGTRIDSTEGRSTANQAPRVQVAGPVPPEAYMQALTGDSRIDDVTKKLTQILQDTIDALARMPGQPQQYGIAVHAAFAGRVITAGIGGISPLDVERPFSLPPGYGGDREFVIPDVVLRNDVGDIIAVYDVKTGNEGFRPSRVNELRAALRADSSVYFIELSQLRGAMRKIRVE